MPLIPEEKLTEIRTHTDIVNFVSQYLQLEKKGRNYWALCPFHQDSNPSLSVSSEKQIFHCFVCGMSGNVFKFIQELQQISFLQAVKIVAAYANIDISQFETYVPEKYSELQLEIFHLNEFVKVYYMNNLQTVNGKLAREYLITRKIDASLISQYEIGYASASYDELTQFLLQKKYSLQLLQQAGICKISQNNNVQDYFYNRIIFPIKNEDGYIIGFSGRIFNSEKIQAKYLNSPETVIFKKEQIMYNFNFSKTKIRQLNEIILLEGYMDVISLTKIGINNTIALMGTNLSEFHLQKLKSLNVLVKIFLDGDNPGINAALKIAKKLLSHKIKVQIVNNNTAYDPDELVNADEKETILTLLKNSVHPVDFAINYFATKFNLQDATQLREYLMHISELLLIANDNLLAELTINKLEGLLSLDKKVLIEALKLDFLPEKVISSQSVSHSNKNYNKEMNNEIQKNGIKRYRLAEEEMLKQLFFSRGIFEFFEKKMGKFNTALYRHLYYYIINYYEHNLDENKIVRNKFLATISDTKLKTEAEQIWNNNFICHQYNQQGINDLLLLMNDYNIDIEIENLRKKMKNADDEQKQQFLSEIQQLINRKRFKKGI